MDTFPSARRKDNENHGEYSTKPVTLEIFDKMQVSIATLNCYHTRLGTLLADIRLSNIRRDNA